MRGLSIAAALFAALAQAGAQAPSKPSSHLSKRLPAVALQRTETTHVTVTTSVSDRAAAPGTRVSLLLDVTQKPKMHVYAPGQKELIPISLSLTADGSFKSHLPAFPPAEKYFFEPLNETQLVYSKPFRIVQDITIASTPAVREKARNADAVLVIAGTLRYQACDDKVCYLPQHVPVSWTIQIKAVER